MARPPSPADRDRSGIVVAERLSTGAERVAEDGRDGAEGRRHELSHQWSSDATDRTARTGDEEVRDAADRLVAAASSRQMEGRQRRAHHRGAPPAGCRAPGKSRRQTYRGTDERPPGEDGHAQQAPAPPTVRLNAHPPAQRPRLVGPGRHEGPQARCFPAAVAELTSIGSSAPAARGRRPRTGTPAPRAWRPSRTPTHVRRPQWALPSETEK